MQQHSHPVDAEVDVFGGGLAECEVDGAGDGPAVEPAVGVNADCLAFEVGNVARAVDGFQEGDEAWVGVSKYGEWDEVPGGG